MQLTYMDKSLHRARMLDIHGDHEQAINLYKELIMYIMDLKKQYPQYETYYNDYIQLIMEEAEAIRSMHPLNQRQQNIYSSQSSYNSIQTSQTAPTTTSEGLTMSDIRHAAIGVGNRVQQFDQQYGVSDKCKQFGQTCVDKAKELDREYEIRKKATEFGHQIRDWDERNGVSQAVVNGVKQVATSVGGAIKGFADQSRQEQAQQRHV